MSYFHYGTQRGWIQWRGYLITKEHTENTETSSEKLLVSAQIMEDLLNVIVLFELVHNR